MNVPGFHKRMLCGRQRTSNAFRMVSMRERLFSVELTFVLFFGHRPRSGAEIDKAIASVRDGAEKVQLIRGTLAG